MAFSAGWAAAVAAAVYLVAYCWQDASLKKTVAKTAAVSMLAIYALMLGGPWGLVLALLLCSLGDLLLSLDDERMFLAGVGAFAAGHVVFILLLLGLDQSDFGRWFETWRMLVLLGLIVLGGVMAAVLWPRAGELRTAVVAYIPIILAMGFAALTLPSGGAGQTILVGAAFFIVSDLVLALEMFVTDERAMTRRFTPFLVWASYWLAVVFLTVGILMGALTGTV